MAIHCGACGIPIGSAADNEGSFQVNSDFKGWNTWNGKAHIPDTCETCAPILREAVTKAANEIVKKNRQRVTKLTEKIAAYKAAEDEAKREAEEDHLAFLAWKRKGRNP